ncbi:MAG: hypothetical protein U9Q35_15515, partial [Pseudomonadota bacterium]|nr:hypothetical protein [Pseudomonadota bacterium]
MCPPRDCSPEESGDEATFKGLMLTLTQQDVLLGCRAADWRDALDQAAAALVDAGRATPEYRNG